MTVIGEDLLRTYGESSGNTTAAHRDERSGEARVTSLVGAAEMASGARPRPRPEVPDMGVRRCGGSAANRQFLGGVTALGPIDVIGSRELRAGGDAR